MNYSEFKKANDYLKVKQKVIMFTIVKVDFKNNIAIIKTDINISNIPIDLLISNICKGRCCLSNPSKLETWKGFKEKKQRYRIKGFKKGVFDYNNFELFDLKENLSLDYIDVCDMIRSSLEESEIYDVSSKELDNYVEDFIIKVEQGTDEDMLDIVYSII